MPSFNYNFWTENGRELKKPDLTCLKQDHYLYKTLLLQLLGKIEYDANGIRLEDKDLASAKFGLFIDKAIYENVDLAVTPEYSCPWSSIENFISENRLPKENKLWIIGCQSIKPNEFKELISKHENIEWIYDRELVENNINENKFFDPVCIFFKTKNSNDILKDIIIVQFKTCSFGGADSAWERDNFIQGNNFYVLENKIKSTKLVTLICSDTLQDLNFKTTDNGYFQNDGLLIVHIQLNQKPFESSYKSYRTNIYSYGSKEDYNKEIICLNWAKGVSYLEQGHIKIFNKYGGSALYCKTDKIAKENERINQNHSKGLYYTNWAEKKSHVYFLNYDEYIFLIENTKPSQEDSLPAQKKRTGPNVLNVYKWNNLWEEISTIDDGFSKICSEIENAAGDLVCLTGNKNFVEVERIIQLSCGEINNSAKEKWSEILNLLSFQITDTEINNRITFTQDPDVDAKDKREGKIRKYHFLKNRILNDPLQVPPVFLNAILKFDIDSDSKNIYLLNLYSPINGRKGTAIYLGDRTLAQASAFKAKIENLFSEDHQGKQVIIWYNDPHLKNTFVEGDKPEIGENVSKSTVSFKKTK